VSFDQERLGSDVFNQAAFRDPGGQTVNVLEARTFSPPHLESTVVTTCGYFTEFGIPVRDIAASRDFWEPLGFVALEAEDQPFPRTPLTSGLLNLGLYRTRSLRQPVLTFEDPDMRERLTRLRERGFTLSDEMPDSLDASTNAILEAPEGTRLLLMQSER
jgi:catechol 2,3-dioxygenase-like lactoylglutathione lyase family enzyme